MPTGRTPNPLTASSISDKRLKINELWINDFSAFCLLRGEAETTCTRSIVKSQIVNQAYEKQIEELGQQELLAREKTVRVSDRKLNFETAVSTVMEPIKNPYDYWQNGDLEKRRLLLKMVFSQKVPYSKISGFETANLWLPIKVFERFQSSNYQQVEEGILKSHAKKELRRIYNTYFVFCFGPRSLKANKMLGGRVSILETSDETIKCPNPNFI